LDTEDSHPLSLAALLQPLSLERFFAEYWERQHLHQRAVQPRLYQQLISVSDLERIICDPNSRFPAIQLARGGRYLSPEAYTSDLKFGGVVFQGVPDVQRIGSEYRGGASIVLPALHRLWPPLGELCRCLERKIDHAVHANAYLTAGNCPGFTPHYDTHEVLVLQIAGSKRWSLYPSPITLPHRGEPFDPARYEAAAPTAQIQLSAGDLLYLPRGTVHSASTQASYSAHVTLGISVYTWADLTRGLPEGSLNDEELRHALPAGFATRPELQEQLTQKLRQSLRHLRPAVDLEQLVQSFIERVRSRTASSTQSFRADVVAIDASSPLQAPPASRYRILEEAEHIVLEFEGKRHRLPRQAQLTLRAMTDQPLFRTSELPGDLAPEGKLGLARYLFDIGFVRSPR
jgi:ribosomal protein L16 Arg81 hydroxylase